MLAAVQVAVTLIQAQAAQAVAVIQEALLVVELLPLVALTLEAVAEALATTMDNQVVLELLFLNTQILAQ
jgi:hypothetical protein